MQKNTKLAILIILGVVLVVGVVLVRSWLQDRTVSVQVDEKIERPALGIAFTFPSGESAYTFFEPVLGTSTPGSPEALFVMIRSDAYTKYQEAPAGGEAPPSMSIFVFEKPDEATSTPETGTSSPDRMTKLRTWAEVNSGFTLYNLKQGDPEEVTLDGVKALHYKADGLYPNDVYLAFYQSRYYVIVGQYDGETDQAYTVFGDLVKSITFI